MKFADGIGIIARRVEQQRPLGDEIISFLRRSRAKHWNTVLLASSHCLVKHSKFSGDDGRNLPSSPERPA
jgi:hypothetical protein